MNPNCGVGEGSGVTSGSVLVSPSTVANSPQSQQYSSELAGLVTYQKPSTSLLAATSATCPGNIDVTNL